MTPNCNFCQKPTQLLQINEAIEHGLLICFCYPCCAEYIFWGNNDLASLSLYKVVNLNLYRYTCLSNDKKINRKIYVIDNNQVPSIPGTSLFQGRLIKEFKSDQEVNPNNISSKISTIITFI